MRIISKDDYYLNIAVAVAKRSSCIDTQYGAVIVKDDVIRSTGYNGSYRGAVNCCDLDKCQREGAPTREEYDKCPAVHAEANALLNAKCDVSGGAIYVAGLYRGILREGRLPCYQCYRLLVNAGIDRVIVPIKTRATAYGIKDIAHTADPCSRTAS